MGMMQRQENQPRLDEINQKNQDTDQDQISTTQEDEDIESNEAKAMVGKPVEEIKLRKLMKQRLQTTNIPDLEFEDNEGNFIKFSEFYDYHKFLGCGSFGFVVSAVDKETGEFLALKERSRNTLEFASTSQRDLISSCKLGLEYRYREMKEYENYIILAIEHAKGGTLADLIKRRYQENRPLSEEESAKIIRGVLQGLKHIHKHEYVHRDMKPSNVVIEDFNNLESVKLVDFGLAIRFHSQGLDDNCGTLVYQAPEQMFCDTSYGKPVDIWAVGFIMYELIRGVHPLWQRGQDKQSYKESMKSLKSLDFPKGKFSNLAIHLIEKLTSIKPSSRYKVEQALTHPWVTRKLDDKLPRTNYEENIFRHEIDEKMRKSVNLLLFLSVVKNNKKIEAEKERIKQEKKKEQKRLQADQKTQLALQQKQEASMKLLESSPVKMQDKTPNFEPQKAQNLQKSGNDVPQTQELDEDEVFLEYLKYSARKNQSTLYSDKYFEELKEPSHLDINQDNDSYMGKSHTLNQKSAAESGDQSSQSVNSSFSNNIKGLERANTLKTGHFTSDRNIGKPPLGQRDTSNNTRDQAPRTQKSFRITKGGKRGSVTNQGGQVLPFQSSQLIKKQYQQIEGGVSPSKQRQQQALHHHETSDNSLIQRQRVSSFELNQVRKSSERRGIVDKNRVGNTSRRNSSTSITRRFTQNASYNQSDADSQDDQTFITPLHKEATIVEQDFEYEATKANFKYKKTSQSAPRRKNKAKIQNKKQQKTSIVATSTATQRNLQIQSDTAKIKQINLPQVVPQQQSPTAPSYKHRNVVAKTSDNFNLQKQKASIKESTDQLQQAISQVQSVVKRNNSSVRNQLSGSRKVISCETFDIIRHGPTLKDRSLDSFQQSPIKGQEISFNQQKNIMALVNLKPCLDEEVQEGLLGQVQQLENKKSTTPLSPFEQFLASLIKQNQDQETHTKQATVAQQQFMYMMHQEMLPKTKLAENIIRKNSMPSQYKGILEKKDETNNLGRHRAFKVGPSAELINLQDPLRNMPLEDIDNQRIFRNTSGVLNTSTKQFNTFNVSQVSGGSKTNSSNLNNHSRTNNY